MNVENLLWELYIEELAKAGIVKPEEIESTVRRSEVAREFAEYAVWDDSKLRQRSYCIPR